MRGDSPSPSEMSSKTTKTSGGDSRQDSNDVRGPTSTNSTGGDSFEDANDVRRPTSTNTGGG